MAALLEVTGLTKAFGVTVVDNLSLAVGTGDAVGVVGPNGAGKTTMLNMIAGDLLPDAGEVRFQGVDITRLPAERRCRAGIARTSQIPRPFEGMPVMRPGTLVS
jgi:branched-chain amino acid transport system ATP-binding protein